MSDTIVVAIITAVVTLAGGFLTFRAQIAKSRRDSEVEIERLQDEIEERLWQRVKTELDLMQDALEIAREKIKTLESKVNEQGTLIVQLRQRITELERENKELRTENESLKKGPGKRL